MNGAKFVDLFVDILFLLVILFSYVGVTKGLTCLRCSDITEPRLCTKIERCQDGEVCAVQQYRADNGDIGYWTGCYPRQECTTVDNRTVVTSKRSQYIDGVVQCRDCCTSDICNAYGCGSPQYPDARGPICFDCENVSNPADCHTIVPCNLNQKCFIHEKTTFGKKYFTSKCESLMGCLPHFTGPVVGRKRDLPGVCLHCCEGDLCNADCSSASNATVNPVQKPTVMPDHVAFHALAYTSTVGKVIVFDHVLTNIGEGYDNTTGVFTVPTPGLYVFSWTIETYGRRTEAVLLVNGVQHALSRADQSSSYYDTTTSFAIRNLTLNDEVNVKVVSGQAEARHTMFAGWKINKTDSVAFNAVLSSQMSSGSVIHFDNKTLDTDNAYTTTTGKFVVPRSGLYVFLMSAVTYGGYEYNSRFYFDNGHSQPEVWVDSVSGQYDSSSYMTFDWFNAGQYVYIRADRMSTSAMFAGFQLSDDSSLSKSTYPAFLASLDSDTRRTPVIFNHIHNVYYHGYSKTAGTFTADRDGIYLFLYNTEVQSGLVRTALAVNGVDKFETRSDGRHSGYDDTSATAVLELSRNDRVAINVKSGEVDSGQSLFFGILLIEL